MTRPPLLLSQGLMLASALMLAGCDSLSAPKAGPTASSEVLPGTVNDAMLNTDRSQAQPPLAPVADNPDAKDRTPDSAAASQAAPETSAATKAEPAPETAPPNLRPMAIPKPTAT